MSAEVTWKFGDPEIRLPRWDARRAPTCFAYSPTGYSCTRVNGYHGRHAACGTRGQVLAVWS